MLVKTFSYPVVIKESYLDAFGHVNNAMYLTLYEEARWELITNNNFGLDEIVKTGMGPTILEIKLKFLKELRLRDEIVIETKVKSYGDITGIIEQKMLRGAEVCSEAELMIGLFNLKKRKLVAPTEEWLNAVGVCS